MERVTETKLSLEALRQMKSHGRTASPTLIGGSVSKSVSVQAPSDSSDMQI